MAGLPFGGNNDTPASGDDLANLPAPGAAPQEQGKRSKREDKRAAKQQAKYGVFDPNELKKGRGLLGFLSTGGGKLTVASVIMALVAGAGVYVYTVDNSATIQELVLKNDIAANTLLTAEDVVPVEVPQDSVQDPSLLVTQAQIASGKAYTKVALKRNTVLMLGSIGPYTRLSTELPEGMQLVSISVPPENAAGGSVAAGDIVNIFGNSETSPVFMNGMKGIRVVDVIVAPSDIAKSATSDPASGDSTVGSDSPDLKRGIGSVYKLAVTSQQAAEIAKAVVAGTTFYLVLTDGKSETPGEPTVDVAPIPTGTVPNPVTDPVTDAIGAVNDLVNPNGSASTEANPEGAPAANGSPSAAPSEPVNPNTQPTTPAPNASPSTR